MFKRILAALFSLAALSAGQARADTARDYYFWRPATADAAPRPWAVLLPGSGGMSILGDDQHYFRAAQWLNARGIDALIVDYHHAARFVPAARDGESGDRMAAIVRDAIAVEREHGRMGANCPGAVIGWSLGGEGAWSLARDGLSDSALAAAVMFYPTVRTPRPYANVLPILVLQGQADNVTPVGDVQAFVSERAEGAGELNVHVFAGATHGFDVPSLDPPRSMRLPPLVGQRVTFGYDAAAANNAYAELEAFLRRHTIIGGACGQASP